MKHKKIIWEQPDKNKELYLGIVEERVLFVIELKGYKFYCSSTRQALIGMYDDWGNDLETLKKRAEIALDNKGVVNHILN